MIRHELAGHIVLSEISAKLGRRFDPRDTIDRQAEGTPACAGQDDRSVIPTNPRNSVMQGMEAAPTDTPTQEFRAVGFWLAHNTTVCVSCPEEVRSP